MAVIQVHIDANGYVVDREVRANRAAQDVVVWLSANGATYTLVFNDGSPFAEELFQVPGGKPVLRDAAIRKYKYDVFGSNGRKTDDPDVIIE